jgi:predicted Zn-dependent peptidase
MLKPVVLKNGLTVLRLPRSGTNTFLVGFVATTGAALEHDHFPQGISSVVEKLFWRGTDKHNSPRSLNLALESMGGQFYSQTGFETTQYYLSVPSYHQHKAISMLSEVIQHSYFEPRDVEALKRSYVENFKIHEEDVYSSGRELTLSNLYQNYNLGLPIRGQVDSILSISQENIGDYLAHQYRPDKSFLIVAGNFDNKSAMELVEQEWNLWNPRIKKFFEPEDFRKEMAGELPRLNYKQRGLSKTHLALGFLLEGGLQPQAEAGSEEEKTEINTKELLENMLSDWAKLLVLNAVLGQGLSSRLWTKGVEEEMFFETIQSDVVLFRSTGFLNISGTTDNSQFTFALESIMSSLEALKKTTVSINELSKAKEYLKGRMLLEQDDLLTSTIWQVEHLLGSGLTFELSDLIAKIDKVDAASLRALALDLFVSERMAMTTVGTAKQTMLVDKLIKKYLN